MSVAETIRVAEASGIRLRAEGTDLVLDADLEPPVDVVNAIRRHKAEIIELLAPPGDRWTAEDWRAFYDERAGIAEYDSGQPQADAEAFAFESCIVEWLDRHPERSDSGRCAWCERPDRDGHAVVPFGTQSHSHTWLHPECWNDWRQNRRERAQQALAAMGLDAPPKCANGASFPDDFGKNGGA